MRIYFSGNHNYPAKVTGATAGWHISDLLVRGFAELGHDVFFHLKSGEMVEPPPKSVHLVSEPRFDVDILHPQDTDLAETFDSPQKPWLRTHHSPIGAHYVNPKLLEHTVFVSASHAKCFDRKRYVHNGLDPADFIYSATKDDYFLFVVFGLHKALQKGLGTALYLAKELGFRLVIAGAHDNAERERLFCSMCQEQGVEYIGPVAGQQKAELFAGAKALLFPTLLNEPGALVIIEALMSGTPVIASNHGCCPEMISSEVGFICKNHQEYVTALASIDTISSQTCRETALRDFHYLRMAKDYIKAYEAEIQRRS